MPRRPREDREPIILLPDVAEDQRLATLALTNPRNRVRVRREAAGPMPRFHVRYRLQEHIRSLRPALRRSELSIDHDLLNEAIERIAMARLGPVAGTSPPPAPGLVARRLVAVGCRAQLTQEELAVACGCSRSHVNAQITLWRRCEIIVNWGNGWIEFDARFVWRGDHEIRDRYIEIQRCRWPFELRQDGKVILPADPFFESYSSLFWPADADEGTPPLVEEERAAAVGLSPEADRASDDEQ